MFNTELAAWLRTIDGADTIGNCLLDALKAYVRIVRPGEFGIPRFTLSPLFIRAILDFLPVIASGVVELRVTAVALALRITTPLVILENTVVGVTLIRIAKFLLIIVTFPTILGRNIICKPLVAVPTGMLPIFGSVWLP